MSARIRCAYGASRAFEPGSRRFRRLRWRLVPAVLVTGLVTGCGTAKPASKRVQAPGPPTPKVSSRLRAQEAAIHREVLASLHHHSQAGVRYGTIPGYLRNKQTPPANQVLSATVAHPAVAIQGNSVVLHLVHGSALATVVGPDVPDRIQGSADVHTPAAWDLTFAQVHGSVPISPSLFTITDEQGMVLLPHVTVVGGGRLPKIVPAGRPFTLRLTTVVSVGDGKLRYAPDGGAWLAEWDFDVETD